MKNVACLVLGGGKGTRLFPLTQLRSKPAVPLAGKYRLIDIPISNCLNSEINRIYLLTQFNSVSLHRHIRQTYKFDRFGGGFVETLAAEQTFQGADWYQGTADAVRKQIRYVQQHWVDYVLVVSGDQLYRMDFREMLKTHKESGADATIAGLPVDEHDARGFGIMRIDDSGQVTDFVEKPQTDEELDAASTDPAWLDDHGIESRGRRHLASMGIYLFSRDALVDLLMSNDYEDFGKEVFPMAIKTRHVHMHPFDGYWEDIGTIGAFYEANLALASPTPPFDFSDEKSPIYTRPRYLPPTLLERATVTESLISDGCVIQPGTEIEKSVVGLRCRIGRNTKIKNSILMGADFYETDEERARNDAENRPQLGIGEGSVIETALIDKNCRIGKNVRIGPCTNAEDADLEFGMIRDGIFVIPKSTTIPDNTVIAGG